MSWRSLLAALILLAAGGLLAFILLTDSQEPPSPGPTLNVDMAVDAVRLTQARDGRIAWRLDAESGQYDQPSLTVTAHRPVVTFFPERPLEPGVAELIVTAPLGVLSQATSAARLEPQVNATYGSITMTSRILEFDGKNLLTATGDVLIKRGGNSLAAPIVYYDLAAGLFTASEGVEMILTESNAQSMTQTPAQP